MAVGGPTTHTAGVQVRHLEAFVALARARHFGRAADELGQSQSTLSRSIAQLERFVGERLVQRSRTTVGLTDAGHAFLPGATASLDALRRGIAGARRARGTSVVLGIVNAIGYEWLPALRRELAAREEPWPELHPITMSDGFDPLEDVVDVGIYPLPMVPPEGLLSATLGLRQMWVALPAGHRLAERDEIRLPDLHGEPAIAPPAHEVWNANVGLLFRAQDAALAPGRAAVSSFDVMALIAEGRGWTLSASPSDFHPWEGVVFRPLAGVERFRVAAVWSERRSGEERVERLVAALRAAAR